uniref:Wsv390-like protein n=1 Tax=Metapenaeus joyneri majanivirus TaxID=2984280 RepID=A0A9C7BQR2_9VIRU|nr:MAG: wsv390-like protein [Metapenaeus joyneri majanivirus]
MAELSITLGRSPLLDTKSPIVSLIANKQWCRGITNVGSSSSIIDPTNWSTRGHIGMFKTLMGYSELFPDTKKGVEKQTQVVEHFDIIDFNQCPNIGNTEKNIGFNFNNTNSQSLYCVAHIHSHQSDEMLTNQGFATAPGKRITLRRCTSKDNSFYLEENKVDAANIIKSIKKGFATERDVILSSFNEEKNDMCIFTLMVLQGREETPPPIFQQKSYFVADSVDSCDGADGGRTFKEQPNLSHARFRRGDKTGQKFVKVNINREKGCDIHIYHVLLLLS